MSVDQTGAAEREHTLPQRYGLATATFIVISSMVGTGVLTTSGFTVLATGSNQLMLGLWVLGGVVALCGALSLAELAAAMPRSGGDYVFLYEAFGPVVAFLSGWVSFLIGFGAPIAASGFAAGKYLTAPFERTMELPPGTQQAIATAAIVLLSVVHVLGTSQSARIQGITTILKVMILTGIAVAGIIAGWGNWSNLADRPALGELLPWRAEGPFSESVAWQMAFSLVYIGYAYTGWNGAAYLAGEVAEPQRKLPRAILLGTGMVVALYLALNLMYALALPAVDVREMVSDPANTRGAEVVAPIAEVAARRLYGPGVSGLLSVAVGLTMLASLSAFILTGPRVAYAMSRAGQFPALAGRLTKRGTPAVATALQSGWAIVLLWSGKFESIVIYAGVGLSLFGMLTVAAVYVLRWRRPELERPFRTPGYPVTPAVFLVVTALLTAAAFSERPRVSLYALLSILAGIPIYYVGAYLSRRTGGAASP